MALLVCGGAMVRGQKLSDMIKKNIISEVFEPDPGLAASAIRLSFHDCVGDDDDDCVASSSVHPKSFS